MRRLIRDTDRKVFLILDNLRVHHSTKVRLWRAEARKEQIALFYLPSYSPDLNPDEYLNNDLKTEISKRPETRRKGTLKKTARSHMLKIQRTPQRVCSYFRAEPIRYAS